MLKGYQRGQTQCEAVSMDKWQCSPHNWERCQKWAHTERDGLKVCHLHSRTRFICRWEIPEAERPHWSKWKRGRRRA